MPIQQSYTEWDPALVATLRRRWRSGLHVGDAKPVVRGYVRTAKLQRKLRVVQGSEVYAHIPNWQGGRTIWQGKWKPKTGWKALPPILSLDGDQDMSDSKGVETMTIVLENVAMVEKSGGIGTFHKVERGYYSPLRGFDPKGRPAVPGEKNDWFDILRDKSSQIILLAGYGDAVVPIFEGLINSADFGSRPDRVTIVARDGGQVPTDQHVFLNAKVRHVKDPITFADRRTAEEREQVGGGAEASDHIPERGARFVLDNLDSTWWQSRARNAATPNDLPWVQISLPRGRYDSFRIHPRFDEMECYVAIRARDQDAPGGKGAKKHYYGDTYTDGEWIDEGKGKIPGTNIPYVRHIRDLKGKPTTQGLPDYGYDLGNNSKLRLYFSNLDRGRAGSTKDRKFRAGVIRLQGVRRKLKEEAKKQKWILVDDLADVVRTVFQWCGLNHWEVETTGVRLKEKAVFNRGNFLIDIIDQASEQVGYVFYVKPRSSFDEGNLNDLSDDDSMGVAVWRQANALRKGRGVRGAIEEAREDTILSEPRVQFDDEPLSFNIRVRGKEATEREGGRRNSGDMVRRWMYVYTPPWSRSASYRNGNIKKYVVHHDYKLRSLEECKIAALFIAMNQTLESAQSIVSVPCMPTVRLDDQFAVLDEGTGLSSRIWVLSRQLQYQGGDKGFFKMTVGGPLLDTNDVQDVREELVKALRNRGYDPGLSQWEQEHWGHVYRGN